MLLYSLVLVHHQPPHNSIVKLQPLMVAYAPMIWLGYGWPRLGSLNGSDFSCSISVSHSHCRSWLGLVALLHVPLIFLGQVVLLRYVLLSAITEILDSKLHPTSAVEALATSQWLGPSVKLSHMTKQSCSVGKETLPLDMELGARYTCLSNNLTYQATYLRELIGELYVQSYVTCLIKSWVHSEGSIKLGNLLLIIIVFIWWMIQLRLREVR